MAYDTLSYGAGLYGRREKTYKSKRQQAADLINEGRKLAREALAEENLEQALDAEYGPKASTGGARDLACSNRLS